MRTGPFSSKSVIDRLNSRYIPVYAVNEDYREGGSVPQDEKDLYRSIYREALDGGFSAGTVHVYVLSPEGRVIGTRHVADAAQTDELIEFLDDMTGQLGTKSGEVIVQPRPQSVSPECEPESLVLHLVARPLRSGGSWYGTAEDWICYSPEESGQFVDELRQPGATSELPAELAARLLTHVYPVTENNDVSKNEILEHSFRLTRLPDHNKVARARIDGHLVMRHDFYHQPDGKKVEAKLIGYLEWDLATGRIQTFRLVTDEATYGGGEFAVAVRSEVVLENSFRYVK